MDFLLYGLIDAVVDGHFTAVQDLDEEIEEALFARDQSKPKRRQLA